MPIPEVNEVLRDFANELLNLASSIEHKTCHVPDEHQREIIRLAHGRLLKIRCGDLQLAFAHYQKADIEQIMSDISEILYSI